MKYFLLALLCSLCGVPIHAQAQARTSSQVRIVDVLPSVDPGITPETPFIGLDFLVGAWPRPAWWGRNFARTSLPFYREMKAQLSAKRGSETTSLPLSSCSVYRPRWNEALGLYTVHVRAPFKGTTWPKNAKVDFQGALPAPFEIGSTSPTLPFHVEFEARPKVGFADAQLLSPRPSLWIKWVRVFQVAPDENSDFHWGGFEADVMLAGRRAKKRTVVIHMEQVVDEAGKEVSPAQNGAWSHLGHFGSPDVNMGNLEFADSPFEFALYRFGWDKGVADASANEFVRQTIEYGGREPLTLQFPVKREGVFLEGEVSPRDWKIEPPTPASN